MCPQIRCPNCGITINSENRRKTDLGLIVRAVQKKPRSFTDLLKITELPRKTLSLRLKELMGMDVLTKNGLYYFNEEANCTKELMQVQKNPIVIRRKMLLAFVVLAIMVPAGLQAYALFQPKVDTPPPPTIKGYFTAHVLVEDVTDLYGWSAVIEYDTDNTRWVEIMPGSVDTHRYVNNSFPEIGVLLVGGLIQYGQNQGVTGSDLTLVSIKFGYYSEDFVDPILLDEYVPHKTTLLNSDNEKIPIEVLKLEIER